MRCRRSLYKVSVLEAEIDAGEVQNFFAIGILGDEGDVPFAGFDIFDKELGRLIDHRLVGYPHASRTDRKLYKLDSECPGGSMLS